MTTDEQMRIQRFQALVNAAIKYTGVNLKAVAKQRMLGDVVQIEAELAFVLVKEWQQPERTPIEFPNGVSDEMPPKDTATENASTIVDSDNRKPNG